MEKKNTRIISGIVLAIGLVLSIWGICKLNKVGTFSSNTSNGSTSGSGSSGGNKGGSSNVESLTTN